jgi:hypothetical protein
MACSQIGGGSVVGSGGCPHTQGLSLGVGLDGGDPGGVVDVVRIGEALPGDAVWREIRHQASCRFSQQAPTEM